MDGWIFGQFLQEIQSLCYCSEVSENCPQQVRLLPDACLTSPELHLIFNFVHVFLWTEFLQPRKTGFWNHYQVQWFQDLISTFCRHCGLQNKDLHVALKHFASSIKQINKNSDIQKFDTIIPNQDKAECTLWVEIVPDIL